MFHDGRKLSLIGTPSKERERDKPDHSMFVEEETREQVKSKEGLGLQLAQEQTTSDEGSREMETGEGAKVK